MKSYPRILLAGLMSLPAGDGLRHDDLWLCASFAVGAAFVLAANHLFGEIAAPETVYETRLPTSLAGPKTGKASTRMRANCARTVNRPRKWRLVNL